MKAEQPPIPKKETDPQGSQDFRSDIEMPEIKSDRLEITSKPITPKRIKITQGQKEYMIGQED